MVVTNAVGSQRKNLTRSHSSILGGDLHLRRRFVVTRLKYMTKAIHRLRDLNPENGHENIALLWKQRRDMAFELEQIDKSLKKVEAGI